MNKRLLPFLLIVLMVVAASCKPKNSDTSIYYSDSSAATGSGQCQSCCCGGCQSKIETCSAFLTIVDEKGLPMADAEVTLYGGDTVKLGVTDADGQVFFTKLPDGDYVYKVDKTGYPRKTGFFTVEDSICPRDLRISVIRTVVVTNTCDFMVTVRDRTTNLAIPFATVVLNGKTYKANSSGIVVLEDISVGSYTYSITADGYLPVKGSFNLADLKNCADQIATLEPIAKPCDVTFVIYGPKGEIQAGASITINGSVYKDEDKDGKITVTGLATGEYSYVVTADTAANAAGYSGAFTIKAGACPEKEFSVTLTTDYKLIDVTFVVRDKKTGAAIPNARITLTGYSGTMTTDANGKVVSKYNNGASYEYTVSADGYYSKTATFSLSGSSISIPIDMVQGDGVVVVVTSKE